MLIWHHNIHRKSDPNHNKMCKTLNNNVRFRPNFAKRWWVKSVAGHTTYFKQTQGFAIFAVFCKEVFTVGQLVSRGGVFTQSVREPGTLFPGSKGPLLFQTSRRQFSNGAKFGSEQGSKQRIPPTFIRNLGITRTFLIPTFKNTPFGHWFCKH